MPAFVWDTDAKFKLLLAVIELAKPSSPNWDQVANMIGGGVSGNAVRQQYQKIRRDGGSKNAAGGSATPSPVKPSPSKPREKRKLDTEIASDLAGDDQESPVKKPRASEPAKPEPATKSELSIKPDPEDHDEELA